MSKPNLSLEERYYVAENGCWISMGSRTSAGYGHFKEPNYGKTVLTHIAMYEYKRGPVPSGMELDHLCRNRACCNPDHLEVVTRKVNARRGNFAKLSPVIISSLKEDHKSGYNLQGLSLKYGVSTSCVSRALRGKTWA